MTAFLIRTEVIVRIAAMVLAAAHAKKVCRTATEFLDHY